jgi:hypothetical protein
MHVSCDADPGNTPKRPPDGQPIPGVEVVNPLGFKDWDSLLVEHPEATIFHTSAWARTLVDTYGFVPQYLVQRDGPRLLSLFPLMETGSRWIGHRCVSLPFTDGCAPLISSGLLPCPEHQPRETDRPRESLQEVAASEPLLAAALRIANHLGCKALELRDCNRWTSQVLPSVVFHGHVVHLNLSEEEQLQRCSPAMRRGLRKAGRSPLQLKEGRDLADVEAYYSLHCETRRRHGLPPQPIAFFRNIQRHILSQGLGFVLLALDGDVPVAGAVFFGFGSHALYKFGASSDSHLELRPNNLVLWQGIRRCSQLGFSTLDLGRTSLDNEGLRRFKLGLGGEERLIHYVRQELRSGRIVVTPDRAQGWHSKVFRCLPRALSRAVGTLMYRFAA